LARSSRFRPAASSSMSTDTLSRCQYYKASTHAPILHRLSLFFNICMMYYVHMYIWLRFVPNRFRLGLFLFSKADRKTMSLLYGQKHYFRCATRI
jgi:hypothetical protein